MSSAYRKAKKVRTPQQKVAWERQIATTDRQVDELVYELYDRTDDALRIVEDATTGKWETTAETAR